MTKTTSPLSRRSQIAFRWNNSIDYVQGRKSVDNCTPDATGTPSAILKAFEHVRKNHGSAFFVYSFIRLVNGETVTLEELERVVDGY